MRQPRGLAVCLFLTFAATAQALCPNGVIEPPETCDDGNLVAGDGCSPLCLLEVPNLPPVCDDAYASVTDLWPPNHKLVAVTVDGVVDPDGDPVFITIGPVAQDEPVDDTGDGQSCPDAEGVGTDVVGLRAERSGQGDGRVYHVAFQADDGLGGVCAGDVEVCVRHDNGRGAACGDQGPLFDSSIGACVPDDHDDDCDLDECLPPPPFDGYCDDVPVPRIVKVRLARAYRLLARAELAPPRLQRRLARRASVRLTRIETLIERRIDGDCQFALDRMVERAGHCAACPLPDDPFDDDGHDDD